MWSALGFAYGQVSEFNAAIEAYRQALRIKPEYAEVWYELGVAYSRLGQRGEVVAIYKRLKGIDPTMAERFFKEVVIP